MAQPLKIAFAAAEMAPLVKIGGLADVAGALPRHLAAAGHDVRAFLPAYSSIAAGRAPVHPVEFIGTIPITLGTRTYQVTAKTTELPGTGFWIYLVDCPELFHRDRPYTDDPDEAQRFVVFSRAVLEFCQRMGWSPDVVHCNDWHTALIPVMLRANYAWDGLFRSTRTLLTLHNIAYQGGFPAAQLSQLGLAEHVRWLDQEDLRAGRINFLRSGLWLADAISAVSPTYAREIQGDELGMGLAPLLRERNERLVGILNGVDYQEWSPDTDRFLPYPYSISNLGGKRQNKRFVLEQLKLDPDPDAPLVGIISRLVPQKGLDLTFDVLPRALESTPLRLAVLGSGERRYEEFFSGLEQRFRGRVCFWRGFNEELAHLIEGAADMFLMPSRFEPCGLNQMYSLRYGTIPIVRRTGGLADSVEPWVPGRPNGTGIVFDHFDSAGLAWALGRALAGYRRPHEWRELMLRAMTRDFSWQRQSRQYVELYLRMMRL